MHNRMLYHACSYDDVEVVENLLAEGADVNSVDEQGGGTPLHRAAELGHAHVVTLLLEKRADVGADKRGKLPIHLAVSGGHLDVLKLLIEARSSIDMPDGESGDSPLHVAVKLGNQQVIAELVSAGASARDNTNRSGLTALELAETKNMSYSVLWRLREGKKKQYTVWTSWNIVSGSVLLLSAVLLSYGLYRYFYQGQPEETVQAVDDDDMMSFPSSALENAITKRKD